MMICDNPKCEHHKRKIGPNPQYEKVLGPVLPNGSQAILLIKRHLYRNRFGMEFYLCDTCHGAAQLVGGER